MGDHILAILFNEMAQGRRSFESSCRIVNLILQHCKDNNLEGYGTIQYKRRTGLETSRASILHCAIPRRPCEYTGRLPGLLHQLVGYEPDVNTPDKNGNTPLLYSLYYTPASVVTTSAHAWLRAGADIKTRNVYGENGLHILCRRLSACNIPSLSDDTREQIIGLLSRMIQQGVDPTRGNKLGYNSIDAAMSPSAWPLLCKALRRVGTSMREELRLLDAILGVHITESEVQAKVAGTLNQGAHVVKLEHNCPEPAATTVCYLCGGGSDVFSRAYPFDEFYSAVFEEVGEYIHLQQARHVDGGTCLHIHEEDSSFTLDYHPTEMTPEQLKKRSLRRHVAAVLEERGLLSAEVTPVK